MTPARMQRAAEVLREDATALKDCHTTADDDWGDDQEAREAHEEMMELAAELDAHAAATSEHTENRMLRDPVCSSGAWANLQCDVCGERFNGFHKLNAAGDRCCPYCWGLETEAGGGLG